MRNLVGWKDHVVEHPGRYTKEEAGGYVTLTKAPGTIKTQGTPQNAENFNTMDLAALEAMLMASEASRALIHMGNTVGGLVGEKIPVTLTNTQDYPHNNSKKTVQLPVSRNNTDYTIECEVVSVDGGSVGEFEFSDKLLNGFKIAFTGSAESVIVNCYVRGGI